MREDRERERGGEASGVSELTLRVSYSEIDRMGVVYYACYLVWLERARTEYLRERGATYADLERQGVLLPVGEARIRYRQPARYDELVTVRCWVREVRSRRLSFGYSVHHADTGRLIATAETSLLILDRDFGWSRLPPAFAERLLPIPDPVRL